MIPTEAEVTALKDTMERLGNVYLDAKTEFDVAMKAYRAARTVLFAQNFLAASRDARRDEHEKEEDCG